MSFVLFLTVYLNYLLLTHPVLSRSISSDTNVNQIFERTIQVKNAISTKQDDLLCTYIKVDQTKRQYILGYKPHADKRIAHHMVLYGCKNPGRLLNDPENENWFCGINSEGICAKEENGPAAENIIYAWALNAGNLDFPEGTGIRVGGDTNYQYLVLQMHYASKFTENQVDNSGLTLKMTYEDMPYQVGLYIMGNSGYIPSKQKEYYMESGCKFQMPFELVPFAYRVHAHNLGKVISAYVVREDGSYFEIGRMSPQQPQLFYNVTTPNLIIGQTDRLISRCTMNSMSRDEYTAIGPRNHDEMCNFYIMYYTNFRENIEDLFCFKDAQHFSWQNDLNFKTNIEDASNLDNVHLIEPDNEMHAKMSHLI